MSSHSPSIKSYVAVFLALMVLTALTVWAAFQHLGVLNDVVALSIAACKATLVVMFFMHVKGSSRMTKLVVASGLFWLAILLALTLADYFSRGELPGAGPVLFY